MGASSGHILVVDDSDDGREILAHHLRLAGFEVRTAENGRRALQLLSHLRFDAILLDVMMPAISGLDVLREIRRVHSAAELPVLMQTARDGSDDVVRALGMGANDYVTKPLDLPVLLARLETHVALKQSVQRVLELEKQLASRNAELEEANARMSTDLKTAAAVQRSLLPPGVPTSERARFAWSFRPTAELAGDILNVFHLDDNRIGLFVLDVSGHGVAAALLSVTVTRFLSPARDRSSLLWKPDPDAPTDPQRFRVAAPAEVARKLNRRFPFDGENNQFFTIVYGVLDATTGEFTWANAGHPGPILLPKEGEARLLQQSDLPIGVVGDAGYEQHSLKLAPGDRVILYTDGVTEAMSATGEVLGVPRLLRLIETRRERPVDEIVDAVSQRVNDWCGHWRCKDDVTMLGFEIRPHGAATS